MPFNPYDEEELEQQAAAPVERPVADEVQEYIRRNFNPEAVRAAQAQRDENVAVSGLFQALGNYGLGLQGKGPSNDMVASARASGDAKVKELMGEDETRRNMIKDFIANKRMEAHDKQLAEDRKLRQQELEAYRRASRQDRADRAAERLEFRKRDKLDKDVNKFSGEISKTGIPEAQNTFDQIDQVLSNPENRKDIPGYGFVEGTAREIPLVGNLIDAWSSGDTTKMRQAVQGMMNVTLKKRSGAAVTLPEMERFKKEFGAGAFKTEDQLMTALRRVRDEFEREKQNIMAGTDPEAVEEYVGRGGSRRYVESTRPDWMGDAPATKVVNGITFEKNPSDGKWYPKQSNTAGR